MNLRLTDKVALVTGSTAGIGLAIAQSLAGEGAHVYVNGRTQERVNAAISAIRSHARAAKVDGIVADFSGAAGAEALNATAIIKAARITTPRILIFMNYSSSSDFWLGLPDVPQSTVCTFAAMTLPT